LISYLPGGKVEPTGSFYLLPGPEIEPILFFVDFSLPETENMLLFYQFYNAIFNAEGPCFSHFFNHFSYVN